jgi:hypothetical protein
MTDGFGLVVRGGLAKSDVDRAIRILELLKHRVASVLRCLKAPDSTPANLVNGLVVRFCGVVYRDGDISHHICGGEYWGRGRSGRYLDVGGRAANRVRASEWVVRNFECYLHSVWMWMLDLVYSVVRSHYLHTLSVVWSHCGVLNTLLLEPILPS